MAATRPRYCGVLLVAAMWLIGTIAGPSASDAAQSDRRKKPPPPPFESLFPLEEGWMVSLPYPAIAAPAEDGTRIFVPLDKALVAIAWETGETVWSMPLQSTCAPAVAGGLVYVAAGGALHALDAATGAERWQRPVSDPIRTLYAARASVFGASASSVVAFDAQSGQESWTHMVPASGDPLGMAESPDVVVVTFAGGVVRGLNPVDGSERWMRSVPGVRTAPLVTKNGVYVGSTENRFTSLDARTGKERWNWRAGGYVTGAAADRKFVYYAALDAVLRAVNPGNGHQRWKHDIGTRPLTPPIALDGVVVIAGVAPSLSAFAPLTGAPLGTFELPGEIAGAPLVRSTLVPRATALAAVLKDGRAFGLRALTLLLNEGALQPLLTLPGSPLQRERPPAPPAAPGSGASDGRRDGGAAPGPAAPLPR